MNEGNKDYADFSFFDWRDLIKHLPEAMVTAKNYKSGWIALLSLKPKLISECPIINDFSHEDWLYLLLEVPKLKENCKQWHLFDAYDWDLLITFEYDAFIDIAKNYTQAWAVIIGQDASMAEKFSDWDKFTPKSWSVLLASIPEYSAKFNIRFDLFDCDDWVHLLSIQPQFSERCDKWSNFQEYNWRILLYRQPQFFERYKKFFSDNTKGQLRFF